MEDIDRPIIHDMPALRIPLRCLEENHGLDTSSFQIKTRWIGTTGGVSPLRGFVRGAVRMGTVYSHYVAL